MNKRLQQNDEIAILTLGGEDFIAVCPPDPKPVYILNPGSNQVHPGVELYTMKEDEIVNISSDKTILDGNNNTYFSIVGPRPRNIVRR